MFMTRDLLTRRFSSSENTNQLTQGQMGLDASLESFTHQAADPAALAAMTVGSFAFRFARLGFLQGAASSGLSRIAPRFLVNGAANILGLGVEVSAFRAANNTFASLAGHNPEQEIFDRNGWLGTAVDFAALKSIGHLGAGQNVVLTHLAQANAMVLGHEASAQLGLTSHEKGSYIERLAHAEASNIAMGAGMSLMGALTGGRAQTLERSVDLRIEALNHRSAPDLSESLGARASQITAMGANEALTRVFEGTTPRLGLNPDRVFSENLRDAARVLREQGEAKQREALGDKYKEAATDVEEAIRLLGFINRPQGETRLTREARNQMRVELVQHLENNVLRGRAIEEFTVREQELADYFNARIAAGLDNYERGEFHRPRSAWASPGRRVGFVTAGQGADTIGHLRYLYNAYPEARRFIESEAPLLLEMSLNHPDAQVGHEIDLLKWITQPETAPSQLELNAIDRSSAIIPIATLANMEVVSRRGFDPREAARAEVEEARRNGVEFKGITGFSQGIMTALAIANGLTPRQAWKELYYQGLSYRQSDPGYATRKPMGSGSNVSREELKAWANEITGPTQKGGLGAEHRLSINRNTDWTHTITGTTEALARIQAKITAENQKDNRKGVREIGFIALDTEGRFHNEVGMARGEELLFGYHRGDPDFAQYYPTGEDGAPATRMELNMPVFSTFDGADLRAEANPLARTVKDRSTREFDYVAQCQQFIGSVDLIIDLGPDSAVGGMARRNLAGTGIRVISFKPETGWSELFTTNPQQVKPGKVYEQAQVVRLPDGTLFIDNRYLRANRGEVGSFVQIGAMTPMTGPTDTVVQAANQEGMVVGLSSGSWGAELPNAMREVNEGTRGEVATNVNLMAIWKGFGGQVEDTFKARAAGASLGIEVTAGLPEDLPGFVNRAQAGGVHHPQLKIGPFGQSHQVAEMLGQNKGMVEGRNGLVVVLEGGEAGGHHAPDKLTEEWAQGYDELREQGVIMGSAGGIATPKEIAQQIVQGPLPGRARPAEVVLVGSVAQNFDVMHTTQAVREANVAASSKDIGDLASQAGGPQHMIMNEYYNRCKRLQAAVDAAAIKDKEGKITGYREFTAAEARAIIDDLNASETKPYFMMRNGEPVELHTMTYAEVMNRWVELSTYQGTMRPPYPEFYNHTFVQMMRVMERTLPGRKEHSVAADADFSTPGAAEAQARRFVEALGDAAHQPIGHELGEVMKNVWHSVGEFKWDGSKVGLVADHFPQRFIYRLANVTVDEKSGDRKVELTVVGDYKSGQTQYAIYEQGYSARNLLIQTGTTAADKITEANIPLRRFHEEAVNETVAAVLARNPGARIREVSEPGAEPFEARSLGKVRGVETLAESAEGGRTTRSYAIPSAERLRSAEVELDRQGFARALLGQGTGVLRTVLDAKYRYDEAGNRVVNHDGALTDLLRVFEPQHGQVVQVVTRPSEVEGGDPVLEAIRVYNGEPSERTLAVEYAATSATQAELKIHEHTADGRDIAFRWNYEVKRHHGYMTRVEERAADTYGTYAELFRSQPADADGIYRSSYTVNERDLDRFRNAVGDDTEAYKVADANGKRMAPLSMIARMGAEAWTASAFAPIAGGNPVNLRHTRDKVTYLGNREVWVREGDTVQTTAQIIEENTTDTGRVRTVKATVFLNGEAVAETVSEFTTLGHFEDVQGFAERKRSLRVKLDNALIRAVRLQHARVEGIRFNLDTNPKPEQELRFDLQEREETSAEGQITSRLSGKVYRGEEEVGSVDHVSTRERGQPHPLIEGAFLKKRTVQASDVANFAPDREPIHTRTKAGQLVPSKYGVASGDINPLHTNPILARKMGMENIIGQGMWTKSSALATLTASPLVNGHPERIHEVDARMLAPVPPGTKLTDRVEEIGAVDGRIVVKVTTTMPNPNEAARAEQPTITVLEMTAKVDQPVTAYGRPGQGDQKPGMFGEILADPVGKRVLEEFDQHARKTYGFSLIEMVQTEDLKELPFRPVAGSRRQAPVKHPRHIIHRTEMSQIALYAYYEARDEMMRAKQVRQRDGIEIGNSLGEYDIPVASRKIARQHGFDLVYFRGRTMQKFVDPLRDSEGNSPFRMDAVAVISREDAARIVEEVRRDTGKFVQVANHNRPTQITITGEIAAVEEAGRRVDAFLASKGKIKAGTSAITKLPIDTPFHSQILAFGIPEFWSLMESIPMQAGESLDGRYVPCIHGEVFRVTPEYAERLIQFIDGYEAGTQTDSFKATAQMMKERGFDTDRLSTQLNDLMAAHRTRLRAYAQALRDGSADRTEAENYFLQIGLVYQFASTVEWVKVQNTVFDPAGPLRAERLIEEGPSSTLKDMESSTSAKEQGHRVALANEGRGFELLSVGVKADWDKLTRAAQAKAASKPAAAVATAAPAPSKAPSSAPAPAASAPQAAAPVSAGAVADRPVGVERIARVLVALARKLKTSEVGDDETLSGISGGSQNAIPVMNDYLGVEFPGVTLPENPHKSLKFSELAATIAGQVSVAGPGPSVKAQFNKRVAANLTGLNDIESAWAHLQSEWDQLPEGRRLEVVLKMLTDSRPEVGEPSLALTGPTDGRAWINSVVKHYAQTEGLAITAASERNTGSGGSAGGMSVDPEQLRVMQWTEIASVALRQVMPGIDVDAVKAALEDRVRLQGEVDGLKARERSNARLRELLGENFANTLDTVFSPDRVRLVAGNFVDAEATGWIYDALGDIRAGRLANAEALNAEQLAKINRMANRATPRTLAMLRYHRSQVANELDAIRDDYPTAQANIERLATESAPEAQIDGARAHLEALRAYGQANQRHLEAWDGVLARVEGAVAAQLPNPNLPGEKLMNPHGAANPPVFRPDDVFAGAYTRPSFEVRPDGSKHYEEVARPGFSTLDLVNEFRQGGVAKRNGVEVEEDAAADYSNKVKVEYISGPDRELVLTAAERVAREGITFQDQLEDGSWAPQTAVFTGASPDSINIENFKAFVAGGGHAVVSTSKAHFNGIVKGTEWGDIPLMEYYERVFHEYRGRGAKLELVNLNVGSDDVKGFVEDLRRRQIYPRYLFNYAAWSLKADAHMMTGTYENRGDALATWNVNFVGFEALMGGLVKNMQQDGVTGYRLVVGVPGSPNKGGLPGGEYPKVQAAKEAFMNLWHSDPTLQENTVMVDHEFGWIRGTNLMADNNNAALPLEQQSGIRTHSQAEASFWTMAGMAPEVLAVAQQRPVRYSSEAGFTPLGHELAPTYGRILGEISEAAEYNKALHEAEEADAKARGVEKKKDAVEPQVRFTPAQAPAIHVRASDTPLTVPLHQSVVVVSADRFVSGGDRMTTRELFTQAGSVKRLGDEQLMRLATIMGRVEWSAQQGRHVDKATKAGEPINPRGVRERYGDWMDQHVGVRQIEPELNGFDPHHDRWLMKITLGEDRVIDNLDRTQLRQLLKEGDEVIPMSGDKFRLVKKAGQVEYFWAEAPLDRQVAGQIPTGWDPMVDGFPKSWLAENSRGATLAIRAIAGALASMGLTPEDIERDPILSHRLGLILGTGLGDQRYAAELHTLAMTNDPARDGAGKPIVEGLTNMPGGKVAMNYLRNYMGPKITNVAACGTTAQSLSIGIMQLITGEADVLIVAGTEAPIGPGSTKRFAEINATQTIDHLKKMGVPEWQAADLVFGVLANGFVPGEGAGVAILTRGDIAFERGWSVEGVLVGVSNTSGGQSIAAASPDRGPVTRLPYLVDAYGRPFGLNANQLGFHETHGTGTVMGDANDASIAHQTGIYRGRTPGNLYIPNAPKRRVGHTMGEAAMDAMIEGLDAFATGNFSPRDGLQTLNAVVDRQLHSLMLGRFGFQVDPASLDAYSFSSYGFGKENFQGVMLNGARYWHRMVLGTHGRQGWVDYQRRNEAARARIEALQGSIRTGRRRLVEMNTAVTKGDATLDKRFDENQRRIADWLQQAGNYQRVMGGGRAR